MASRLQESPVSPKSSGVNPWARVRGQSHPVYTLAIFWALLEEKLAAQGRSSLDTDLGASAPSWDRDNVLTIIMIIHLLGLAPAGS
jgi:hypothetical protein